MGEYFTSIRERNTLAELNDLYNIPTEIIRYLVQRSLVRLNKKKKYIYILQMYIFGRMPARENILI